MQSFCTSVDCTGRISTEQLLVHGPRCHPTLGHIVSRHARTSFWPACMPSYAHVCLGLGYHPSVNQECPASFGAYIHQSQYPFIKTQLYDLYVFPSPRRDIPSKNKYEAIRQGLVFLLPPGDALLDRHELENLLTSTHNSHEAASQKFSGKKTK